MRYWIFLFSAFVFFSTSISAQKNWSKEEVKDIVEKYFITKDVPTRYYSNIIIRLDGEASKGDLAFVNQLVDSLNAHIDKWDVSLISDGTSNLILPINQPKSESYPQERFGNRDKVEIITQRKPVNFPEGTSQLERNKMLYYTLMNSLVRHYKNKEVRELIPESVFVLDNLGEFTVNNPDDFQIINEVYSSKYDDKLKAPVNPINRATKNRQIFILAAIVSNVLSTLFLLWMFLLGVFKNHNYVFKEYFKQGLIVLIAFAIGIVMTVIIPMIYTLSNAGAILGPLLEPILGIILGCLFLGIFTMVILFLLEGQVLKGNTSLSLHVIFPFLTTTIVPASLLFILVEIISAKVSVKLPVANGGEVSFLGTIVSITMSIAFYRAFLIFLSRKSESIINQKDVELARMSEMHRKAELQSLRAKINPHFLYNSLNSIASLASSDPKKTEQMALSLSDFFKYSINREQKQTNPLSDELKAVETYLEIEKVRFAERLTYSVECPEELESVQIPQLLIQPLVENAVKHGISKLLENGEIRIVVSGLEFKKISIRVYDNGPGFPDGPMSGFGIRNTHERLQLIYGSKASINWQNESEKYIEIVISRHPVSKSLKSMQNVQDISTPTQTRKMDMNTIRRLMNILWGIPILFVLIGAFFKLQHYPYGSKLLGIGLISGLIMGVFEIVRLMMTINDEE